MASRVTCISRPNSTSSYEAIVRLGGVSDDNGARWSISRQKCVDLIKEGTKFYVEVSNHKVYLIWQKSSSGLEYVRTDPDHDKADNLLSLPECT